MNTLTAAQQHTERKGPLASSEEEQRAFHRRNRKRGLLWRDKPIRYECGCLGYYGDIIGAVCYHCWVVSLAEAGRCPVGKAEVEDAGSDVVTNLIPAAQLMHETNCFVVSPESPPEIMLGYVSTPCLALISRSGVCRLAYLQSMTLAQMVGELGIHAEDAADIREFLEANLR
jgi:hypothetical protein